MWNKVPKNEYHKGKPGNKKDPFKKDVIFDLKGQYAYPGEVTKIPSGDITMQGVPYPVLGIDNYGNEQMMYPDMDYQFPGDIVTEYPQMLTGGVLQPGGGGRWLDSVNAQFNNQYGGDPSIPKLDQAKKGGWLNKYSKMPKKKSSKNIKTSINKLMTRNPLFERNYMLYGAKGPRLYDLSSKYQFGGWLDTYQEGGIAIASEDDYKKSLVMTNKAPERINAERAWAMKKIQNQEALAKTYAPDKYGANTKPVFTSEGLANPQIPSDLVESYKQVQQKINSKADEKLVYQNNVKQAVQKFGDNYNVKDYIPEDVKKAALAEKSRTGHGIAYCISGVCNTLNEAGDPLKYYSGDVLQTDILQGKLKGWNIEQDTKNVEGGDIIQFLRKNEKGTKGGPYHNALIVPGTIVNNEDGTITFDTYQAIGGGEKMGHKTYTVDPKTDTEVGLTGGKYFQLIKKDFAPSKKELTQRTELEKKIKVYDPEAFNPQKTIRNNTVAPGLTGGQFFLNDDFATQNNISWNDYDTDYRTEGKNLFSNRPNSWLAHASSTGNVSVPKVLAESKLPEIVEKTNDPSYKKKMMDKYNVSNKEYNAMVRASIGIYGQETGFNYSLDKPGETFGKVKETAAASKKLIGSLIAGPIGGANVDSDYSAGPFQINLKWLNDSDKKDFNIDYNTVEDPLTGFDASMIFLAKNMQTLRNRAKEGTRAALNQDNYYDFVPYLYNQQTSLKRTDAEAKKQGKTPLRNPNAPDADNEYVLNINRYANAVLGFIPETTQPVTISANRYTAPMPKAFDSRRAFAMGGWLDSYQMGGAAKSYKKLPNPPTKKPQPSAQQLFGIQPVAAESTGINKTPQAGLDYKNQVAQSFSRAVDERMKYNPNLTREQAQTQVNAGNIYAEGRAKGQGTIRQADPEQGLLSKSLEVASHPFNALDAYVQSGYVPDYFSHNKDAVNPMDHVYSFTPAGWYTQGADALYNDLPTDIEQGNWMGVANDVLMSLPLGVKATQLGRTYIPKQLPGSPNAGYKFPKYSLQSAESQVGIDPVHYRAVNAIKNNSDSYYNFVTETFQPGVKKSYLVNPQFGHDYALPEGMGIDELNEFARRNKAGLIKPYELNDVHESLVKLNPELKNINKNKGDLIHGVASHIAPQDLINLWDKIAQPKGFFGNLKAGYQEAKWKQFTDKNEGFDFMFSPERQKEIIRTYKPTNTPTQLPGSPNNLIPQTPPNPNLGNPLGTIKDLERMRRLEKYGIKTEGDFPLYQRKLDTDLIKYNDEIGTNLNVKYPNPTQADRFTGSAEYYVPQLNQELQKFNTLMQFGKRPLETQIIARPETQRLLAEKAFLENQGDLPLYYYNTPVYPGFSKLQRRPLTGYQMFQQIQPNKYGGSPRKSDKKLVNYSNFVNPQSNSWLDKY